MCMYIIITVGGDVDTVERKTNMYGDRCLDGVAVITKKNSNCHASDVDHIIYVNYFT